MGQLHLRELSECSLRELFFQGIPSCYMDHVQREPIPHIFSNRLPKIRACHKSIIAHMGPSSLQTARQNYVSHLIFGTLLDEPNTTVIHQTCLSIL